MNMDTVVAILDNGEIHFYTVSHVDMFDMQPGDTIDGLTFANMFCIIKWEE